MFFKNIETNPVILVFKSLSEVKVEAETSGDSLGDVDTEGLVHTLVISLEERIVKTLIAT